MAPAQRRKTVNVTEFYDKQHLFLNKESWYPCGCGWQKEQQMKKSKTRHESSVIKKWECTTWRVNEWWVLGWKRERRVCVTKHDIWVVISMSSVVTIKKGALMCFYPFCRSQRWHAFYYSFPRFKCVHSELEKLHPASLQAKLASILSAGVPFSKTQSSSKPGVPL